MRAKIPNLSKFPQNLVSLKMLFRSHFSSKIHETLHNSILIYNLVNPYANFRKIDFFKIYEIFSKKFQEKCHKFWKNQFFENLHRGSIDNISIYNYAKFHEFSMKNVTWIAFLMKPDFWGKWKNFEFWPPTAHLQNIFYNFSRSILTK